MTNIFQFLLRQIIKKCIFQSNSINIDIKSELHENR